MRRSTKPFTVEVKKRGRRRDAVEVVERTTVSPPPVSFQSSVGRDSRFREAESLFRPIPVEPADTEQNAAPLAPPSSDAAPRRILPDLIAEAALSDAPLADVAAPRRRGRPAKDRSADTLPHPAKPHRKVAEPQEEEEFALFSEREEPQPAPVLPPAVLYLAASARRRAARATDNLPRAERWKRRLPKACW